MALTTAGSSSQYLDGSGSYSTPVANPAGGFDEIQFNSAGSLAGDPNLTWNGTTLNATQFNSVALTNAGSSSEYLDATGAYSIPASTAAAGSSTQIQFNTGGAFDASASLTWNGTSLNATQFNGVALTVLGTALDFLDATGAYVAGLDKATYDPTNVNADAFDYANAIGVEQITGTIISPTAISATVDDYNPTDFGTSNMIRQDVTGGDQNFTGMEAPAVGVNRIVKICNISTSGDRISFQNNDAGSLAANRLLLRDNGNRDLRPNETAAFWYDHTSLRWRQMFQLG